METFSIQIKPDTEGFMGRECPECEKYFKIKPGTGIPDSSDCYCPYCKHFGPQDEFWTKAQIEYAQSVALNKFTGDFLKELKKLERKPNKNQFISIGISVTGNPTPITYYSEKELEEKLVCAGCALEYAIYGTFGYCPDCAEHNSPQILEVNFHIISKILELAKDSPDQIRIKLIENCLEDCISVFDGFARERMIEAFPKMSFQNISRARVKILESAGFDIANGLNEHEWDFVKKQFQKRHLIAHKLGIIDDEYIVKTESSDEQLGRKVSVTLEDVDSLIQLLGIMAGNVSKHARAS